MTNIKSTKEFTTLDNLIKSGELEKQHDEIVAKLNEFATTSHF